MDFFGKLGGKVAATQAKQRTGPGRAGGMTDAHKQALAVGREQGRVIRGYLEALESTKPKRGRKRTPDSVRRRLTRRAFGRTFAAGPPNGVG